jgi:hypothetical protein
MRLGQSKVLKLVVVRPMSLKSFYFMPSPECLHCVEPKTSSFSTPVYDAIHVIYDVFILSSLA